MQMSKNEIDYFLVDRKRLIQDVSVVTSFNTGSDHRLFRIKLFFNEVLETRKLQASRAQKKTSLDQQAAQTLAESEKWEDTEDMEEENAKFVNKFKNCIRQSANPSSSKKKKRHPKPNQRYHETST